MPTFPCPSAGSALPRAAVAIVLVVVLVAGLLAEPAGADDRSRPLPGEVLYVPPVDAPVVDPFRPPATPYGPGNRGLAYDVPANTPVRSAADGVVVYAGTIAGSRHVTVLHPDGLRSSYAFLSDTAVWRGQRVRQGDVVGHAGAGFHFGVRDGDAYLDPAALFDAAVVHVRLVPHAEPLPPTDAGLLREQAALRELVRAEQPGFLRRTWNALVRNGAPLVGRVVDVGRAAWHTWQQVQLPSVITDVVVAVLRHVGRECTPSSFTPAAPRPGSRLAVLVGGLGSSSTHASIDDVAVDELGYADGDVLRYRYGGGRVPDDGLHPDLAPITAAPYDSSATLDDIRERGRELADLVQEVAAARPGTPVDVFAHSMGGLVTRVALLELASRPGGLDALGEVVTIATPHGGADLATLAVLSERGHVQDVDLLREWTGIELDPYATSVRQMAESSPFLAELNRAGIPENVSFRTIGATGDAVVTADKTMVRGAPAAVVGMVGLGAHADVPGHPETTRELRLALGGAAPGCRSALEAVAEAVVPEAISLTTDVGGLLAAATG